MSDVLFYIFTGVAGILLGGIIWMFAVEVFSKLNDDINSVGEHEYLNYKVKMKDLSDIRSYLNNQLQTAFVEAKSNKRAINEINELQSILYQSEEYLKRAEFYYENELGKKSNVASKIEEILNSVEPALNTVATNPLVVNAKYDVGELIQDDPSTVDQYEPLYNRVSQPDVVTETPPAALHVLLAKYAAGKLANIPVPSAFGLKGGQSGL